MAKGRVQAPEMQGNIALRPAPIQSDTFAAPARPAQDNRLASLAQALGAFSTSIGDLGSTMKQSPKDRERMEMAAANQFNRLSIEEQRELTDSGKLPEYANDFERNAIFAIAGGTRGKSMVDNLKVEMETEFDWDAGNPDEYITGKMNEYIDNSPYKGEPVFEANFQRQLVAARTWADEFKVNRLGQQHTEAKGQSAFDYITTFVNSQAGKTDPEVLTRTLFNELPILGKKGTLGVNEEALEAEVLNAARHLAGTKPEVALAIINHTRKGRDGMDRSFAMDRDKQDVIAGIKSTAARAIGEQFETRERQRIQDANIELFRAGGAESLSDQTITTPDGREVTITAESQRKDIDKEYARQSSIRAKALRETPTETVFRELRDYRRQGVIHKGLEQKLTGMADMASVDMIGDPESKKLLMDKMDLYRKMRQESKNSIMAYTKEKDRDFGEAFVEATDYLDMSDDAALEFAIKVTQPLDASGREQVAKYQDELDSGINNLAVSKGKGWFGLDRDSDPNNFSTIRTKVSQLATKIVAAGVKPADAITMASNAVKANTQVHNGTMLDLNGLDVPDEFPDAVDEALAQFIQANPKVIERSGLEPEDLTVVPLGGDVSGGRFKIVAKDNVAVALHTDRQEIATLTLPGIRKLWGAKKTAERREIHRKDVFDNSVKQREFVRARDVDGSVNWIDPKKREVYTFQYGDKDDAPIWKKTGKRYKRGIITTEEGGFVLKGFNAGGFAGRLRGSDLKKHREEMKKWGDDHDKAAAERRKFWGKILPSIKVGETVLND
jgi:hypothetical protein